MFSFEGEILIQRHEICLQETKDSTLKTHSLYLRAFLVCSSTQKCSCKEICAVLLSKMCSWQMDNISKNIVNF